VTCQDEEESFDWQMAQLWLCSAVFDELNHVRKVATGIETSWLSRCGGGLDAVLI